MAENPQNYGQQLGPGEAPQQTSFENFGPSDAEAWGAAVANIYANFNNANQTYANNVAAQNAMLAANMKAQQQKTTTVMLVVLLAFAALFLMLYWSKK